MAKQAQLKWEAVEQVLIGYGTAGSVDDQTWNAWVKALQDPNVTSVLNATQGSLEVNSVQRAKANDVLKERGLRVAVVTDEILLRGMVTAASWFIGNSIKAFSSKQIEDAIGFLDARSYSQRVIDALETLRESCEPQ